MSNNIILFHLPGGQLRQVMLDEQMGLAYLFEGNLIWKNGGYDSEETRTNLSFYELCDYAKIVSEELFDIYKHVTSKNWEQTLPQADESKVLLYSFKYEEADEECSHIYIDKNNGMVFLSQYNAKYFQYIDYERFEIIRNRFAKEQVAKYNGINKDNWKEYIQL